MIFPRRFISPLAVAFLVAASTSPVPAQSNASVLAIVGARILDGSGNEPFEGTVVVRDGRIAEVGRSVRPPEGARIIEARGRMVMPGLIDVRVHLPAGATDDALARAMAAYLYAGVTSIGVADLDENKVDALRDHLATAKIRAPRLVAAVAPSNAIFASSLGSAMPDTLAFADWKRRNATLVPEIVSRAANDKKAQDRARSAQQAGVRIAVGSNAGEPDLPPGISTIREVRQLVEGGLTPLQALTAVTSGSAWALGLQSDRAFLAVGQRGDLAILSGEPNAGGGDAAFVEQVFVGGEEIDRAALNAIITRPAPTPPEATAAATTPNSGAAATSAAPVKPAAPASSKTSRTGRKGRTRATDTPTPATTGSEPASTAGSTSSTTSESAASTSATPSAVAPTPADPTAAAPSPASPSAAAPPPAATPPRSAAAPTRSAPAPAPAPSTPASTPSASAPAAAAPSTAAAAPAGAAAAASIPLAEPMIDDFENGGDRTGLGSTWNASNDSGTASDIIVGRVVRGVRDHALHLTARMGDAGEPYARVTVSLAHDGHPADVSQFHGVRFDARGQGRYRIVFVTRGVSDGRYHESYFSGSPLWTPVAIPFASLGQTGAGTQVKWTGTDLLEIAFQFARDPGQMGWLELDNLRFY